MNKSIDWDLGTKLAGNNRQTAEELLLILAKNLPGDIKKITEAWKTENHQAMANHLHKLHGALCYCGTPALKSITEELEQALKQKKFTQLNKLMQQFEQEARQVLTVISALS